jgi:hypothetical protein
MTKERQKTYNVIFIWDERPNLDLKPNLKPFFNFVLTLSNFDYDRFHVATLLWAKCEGEAHTPKSGNLESSGTPKNSELEFRGQTTSH